MSTKQAETPEEFHRELAGERAQQPVVMVFVASTPNLDRLQNDIAEMVKRHRPELIVGGPRWWAR